VRARVALVVELADLAVQAAQVKPGLGAGAQEVWHAVAGDGLLPGDRGASRRQQHDALQQKALQVVLDGRDRIVERGAVDQIVLEHEGVRLLQKRPCPLQPFSGPFLVGVCHRMSPSRRCAIVCRPHATVRTT